MQPPPDHVSMMQIDCEVMNTKLLHIRQDAIPAHMSEQMRGGGGSNGSIQRNQSRGREEEKESPRRNNETATGQQQQQQPHARREEDAPFQDFAYKHKVYDMQDDNIIGSGLEHQNEIVPSPAVRVVKAAEQNHAKRKSGKREGASRKRKNGV